MAERQPEIAIVEPHFPFLIPLARRGPIVAIAVAVVVFALVLLLAGPPSAASIVAGAICALLAYGAMRLLADIARLLVDTLVPK